MRDDDPWLTEREAAAELRVSVMTVRAEREDGRLGFARLRRRVFYPMSMINAYRAALLCPASNSGVTPTIDAGTSPGRKDVDQSDFRQARRIAAKLSSALQQR